jgi:hypothetical protein
LEFLVSPEVDDLAKAAVLVDAMIRGCVLVCLFSRFVLFVLFCCLLKAVLEHHQGSQRLSPKTLKQMRQVLWSVGTTRFSSSHWKLSIEWFQRVFQLLTPEEQALRAKCMRMISRCFWALGDGTSAEHYALQAQKFEPDAAVTYFYLFRVGLLKADETGAIDALQKMSRCQDFHEGFLEACANEAFDRNLLKIATAALERLIRVTKPEEWPGQLPIFARNLVKLYMPQEDEYRTKTPATTTTTKTSLARFSPLSDADLPQRKL